VFDVSPDGRVELGAVSKVFAMDRFGLERMEEGFDVGVVGHGLGPIHALHDPNDALSPHPVATAAQQRMDARAAIDAVAALEVLGDALLQSPVALLSLAGCALHPGVEAGTRNRELLAHPLHFEPFPLPRDEGEPLPFSDARKRSNFFRNSCSFRSASSSLFSLAYFDI